MQRSALREERVHASRDSRVLHGALRGKASGDDVDGRLMGLELRVPDHTTLSRRGRTIDLRSLPRKGDGPLHLVIDSTGLKVVGGGQWNADKHGDSKKRRQWRKLPLGIDLGGFQGGGLYTNQGRGVWVRKCGRRASWATIAGCCSSCSPARRRPSP